MFDADHPAEPNDSVRVTTQNDSTGQGSLITLDMLCGVSEFDASLVADLWPSRGPLAELSQP